MVLFKPFTGDFLHGMNLYVLGINIILSTVHVIVRDRSVSILVKELVVCTI